MIIFALLVLLFGAFITPILHLKFEKLRDLFPIFMIIISFSLILISAPSIFSGKTYTYHLSLWVPPIGIVIVVDSFSLLMALIITGTGLLVGFFSIEYIREKLNEYYTLLLLFLAGMLGVVITGDLFNMFVFFEIMSVASYGLVVWERKKDSLEGGFKYLIIGSLSTSLILLGVALIYGLTGSLTLADIATKIYSGFTFNSALALLLTGFFIKSAVIPFHAWKPDAISGTVEPIAGLFSGVSVAVGVYCIFRILSLFGLFGFSLLIISLGLISMIGGAGLAFVQNDLKRLLAYSSISQIGYVLLAFGLGDLGVSAGIFHLFNNALAKVLLFLTIGIVYFQTGLTDINKIKGLGKDLKIPMYCFFLGLLSVSGIPPLNGFASKWLIYLATWKVTPVLTALAIIISVITLAYYLKAFSIFLGPKNIKIKKKTSKILLVPIILLAVLCLFFGIFPQTAMAFIEPASSDLLNKLNYIKTVMGLSR